MEICDYLLFRHFVELCLPKIAESIDWAHHYEMLDKEFQSISKGIKIGKRVGDKLLKIYEKNGIDAWILGHIEFQSGYEGIFSERMLVYNYRARDIYNKPVMAVYWKCII